MSHSLNMSRLIKFHFGPTPTSILCQLGNFGCGDGAWTPVMKMDGNQVRDLKLLL